MMRWSLGSGLRKSEDTVGGNGAVTFGQRDRGRAPTGAGTHLVLSRNYKVYSEGSVRL